MCCPSKSCCLCLLLIALIILIGFVFGFGVFAHGFHKIKDSLHLDYHDHGFAAPPPLF
ncbi:uncharacterized protein [Typha angustifolia]|uniref:uncharacterized protein n=1 Tax=Typha angustifolia TaxID=59011 RepID=UPI003C2C9ACD